MARVGRMYCCGIWNGLLMFLGSKVKDCLTGLGCGWSWRSCVRSIGIGLEIGIECSMGVAGGGGEGDGERSCGCAFDS